MFQSSQERLRAWLSRFDDILGDSPADARPIPDSAPQGAFDHPHREPLRWRHQRRKGSVPAPPALCLCPVRSSRESGVREPASRRGANRQPAST
jgi:hypothetical protein